MKNWIDITLRQIYSLRENIGRKNMEIQPQLDRLIISPGREIGGSSRKFERRKHANQRIQPLN